MEKLELKHLAPYLPYGLKGKDITEGFDGIREMNIMNIDWFLYNVKPILKPLSELNEDNASFLSSDAYMLVLEDSIRLNNITYLDFEKLISKHYDVFGLIDKCLAVSYSDVQSTSNEG